MGQQRTTVKQALIASAALSFLGACDNFDLDLRNDIGNGFDTSRAVQDLPNRPAPDDRGVISYPNYQVVIAQDGDTPRAIAGRLNIDANELAQFNGMELDVPLRRDEVVALPNRVTEPSPATGALTSGPIQPLDVSAVATTALDRAGPQTPVTTAPLAPATVAPIATPAPVAAPSSGTEPVRHQVARGETVFSISRLFDVPVRNIAEWNGLNSQMTIREGQFLLIPQGGARPPAAATEVSAPGAGTQTPVPPSAAAPLPDEAPEVAVAPPPAPEIAVPEAPAAPAAATSSARLSYPVTGSIIRAYAPGRNEGIDIGVPAGTDVKAADAGSIAAVTTNTSGVAIVVIKHSDGLLTVYTNMENLSVSKGDSVSRGQVIGKVRASDPSFLHFEVRKGLQSVNPAEYLPG